MKNKLIWCLLLLSGPLLSVSQTVFPVNGVNDPQVTRYTFINATIYVTHSQVVQNGILEIEDGKIKSVKKAGEKYDTTSIVIDLKGKYIYPSFIDVYSSYGMPAVPEKKKPGGKPQYNTNTKGAYGWNEAIKPERNAAELFTADEKTAEELRGLGFGAVSTFQADGVARGTSALVCLNDERANKALMKENAAACFSFKKGSSTQVYPTSLMGSVALIRQTFYDAIAYKGGYFTEKNLSLEALNNQLSLPMLFEASSRWDILRIQKIGKEFGYNFTIKTNGDEYLLVDVLKRNPVNLVVPVNFPKPLDLNGYFDINSANYLDLKHRTQATWNPFLLEYNKIGFALTADGLKDKKDFLPNLREAIACGLHDTTALKALTIIPAQYLKVSDQLGTLEKGKLANFIITNGKVFDKNTAILENWVKGIQYKITGAPDAELAGVYDLLVDGAKVVQLSVTVKDNKLMVKPKDSTIKAGKIKYNAVNQQISFDLKTKKETYYLSGWKTNNTYKGTGITSGAVNFNWELAYIKEDSAKKEPKDSVKLLPVFSNLPYTYAARDTNTFMIRNVTVWTNEKEGVIKNTDVLVVNGKIHTVGAIPPNAFPAGTRIINGTGKHLTPGIIDEHSHIAVMGGVNEGSQSVTAEVRIEDVINAEDINIYRQLAGGVTTSQLLHGSANAIGGQSAVIKLKWGQLPDSLLFPGVTPRIKFALGENVKQANWGDDVTERYPQTRMGVEEIFEDAFTRALEYEKAMADFKAGRIKVAPPKNIELDALLEVIKGNRLVTCHSYNQQEINMLIKVAEKFGFKINIFTHVLEGYKVADKIKAHGAGASSFSDWWGYKMEVNDAIPYNAALLHKAGVVTCINSDDAEMGRRLNQEAAKTIKYGGVSEEDALKMITLNPAKLMGIDNRVGSIKPYKDADLVLWSGPPLSVYSKPVMTFIEGVAYFDITKHQQAEEQLAKEKQALVEAMNKAIASGKKPEEPKKEKEKIHHCEDMEIYGEEDEQ